MINKITFTSTKPINKAPQNGPQPTEKELTDNNEQYQDPLSDWKIRSLSYSNEIGAALNVIAPRVGAALWIPTFMYLGADIYDKYKNDKNVYNPSSKRGLEQVISQSFTSILLPAVPILIGQKLTSPIGRIFSDRLSINEKDATIKHIHGFLDHAVGEIFENKDIYEEKLKTSLSNRINAIKHDIKTDNIFKKVYKFFNGDYALANTKKEKLEKFIQQNCQDIFEIKDDLLNGKKNDKISKKIYEQYMNDTPILEQLYGEDKGRQALRSTLKKYETSLIFRNKLIKTMGGIIALILLIKPIDLFTQKTLIEKVVDPGIDILNNTIYETNLMRLKMMNEKGAKVELPNDNTTIEKNETKT